MRMIRVEESVGGRKVRTHHDATVETLLTYSNNDVLAITFEDLGARDHEAIGVGVGCVVAFGTLALGLLPEGDAIVVADLFYGVRLSSYSRFVALHVVTSDEDAIARENFTRL
jgi:hypothetical protein